ncbi:MAG: M1 family aminopeptidase [Bacteroidia bacterium]|nr:M1 family aminopeptidase [Bacteroidia bacterium]
MFKYIFLFELKYRIKRPATYIYFAIMLLLGWGLGSLMAGGIDIATANGLTGGGKNFANSPFNLHQYLISFGQLFGTFVVAAFMGVPVYRDFQYDAHPLFFTKPITKLDYLGGRYLGSMVFAIAAMFMMGIGFYVSTLMPYVEPSKIGPFRFMSYFNPYLMSIIPYTLFSGTIFFGSVALTRNQLLIYLNAVIILVLFSFASNLANELDNDLLASIIDPSTGVAFLKETEYWTVAEKNTLVLPLSAKTGLNLLLWMSITAALAVITYIRFPFTQAFDTGKKKATTPSALPPMVSEPEIIESMQAIELPPVSQEFALNRYLAQLWMLIKREFKGILTSPIFIAIASIGVLMMITSAAFSGTISGQLFGTATLPVTYQILNLLNSNFHLFMVAIIIFYSGELIWKEREVSINELYDALPVPNWLSFASKLLSLLGIVALLLGVIMVSGIIIQAVQQYFRFEIGLYLKTLFGYRFIDYVYIAVLAFFIQTLVNNKYAGFFVVVLVYMFNSLGLGLLNVEHNMLQMYSDPGLQYSDMNGYGHFTWPYFAFKLYWGGFFIVLGLLTNLLWQRGTESNGKARIHLLRQNFTGGSWAVLIGGLVLFIGMGSYIFYNTNVLNEFTNSEQQEEESADFEKKYKKYDGIPQPKITSVKLNVDIFPKKRAFSASGTYLLINKSQVAIDSVHLNIDNNQEFSKLEFSRASEAVMIDEDFGYRIYKLSQPLMPGDSIRLNFEQKYETRGFYNSGSNTSFVYNGTFFNHGYFPSIGYDRNFELNDKEIREKHGLAERARFPSIDDTVAQKFTLISHDADWIDFEATVSTEPDQIAIVPGYLQKEWEENGRRYFHYKMDSKMVKFYSIVSARYEVKRDVWQAPDGREINLEIYYHKPHDYNLDRMMVGMKKSLEYYTQNFGPYQHRQVRILEFPRYAGFAQSFANTIPYSEAVGFIADVDEEDVDYPYYITAHELGHQWWAHQVIGGAVQGFQFLSETMSQYSALMVMEKEFGPENIQKYLKYEMDTYLRQRTAERVEELPALLSENQLYIHYNKGSVIMYALKDYIGEDSLNAAMKRYVAAVKFQEPPYTTTRDWKRYVEAVTPDSMKYVLTDMFETITLFDNQVKDASYTEENGRFKVSIAIEAKKIRDNGKGDETEIALNDYIDVAVFAREKVEGDWKDKTLYFEKQKISRSVDTLTVWVDEKPTKVGFDPYNKLIDRKPDDNTRRITVKKDN